MQWTYGPLPMDYIGLMHLVIMHFLMFSGYRVNTSWLTRISRAVILLLLLALQLFYVTVPAS